MDITSGCQADLGTIGKEVALRLMLILLQQREDLLLTIAQVGIVVFLIAAIALMAALLIRTGMGRRTLPQDKRSWLDYGNLFVVALGIAAVVIGFLVILLFPNRFTNGTEALGFLTALFGVITGVVGTYFGVKQSADAREGAERVALADSAGSTAPTMTIEPPEATKPAGTDHEVIATVTSVDGSPAGNVPVTFTVTAGPDAGRTGTETTGAFGRASFTFTNNGTAGTDTIEATALEGKSTATVTFE